MNKLKILCIWNFFCLSTTRPERIPTGTKTLATLTRTDSIFELGSIFDSSEWCVDFNNPLLKMQLKIDDLLVKIQKNIKSEDVEKKNIKSEDFENLKIFLSEKIVSNKNKIRFLENVTNTLKYCIPEDLTKTNNIPMFIFSLLKYCKNESQGSMIFNFTRRSFASQLDPESVPEPEFVDTFLSNMYGDLLKLFIAWDMLGNQKYITKLIDKIFTASYRFDFHIYQRSIKVIHFLSLHIMSENALKDHVDDQCKFSDTLINDLDLKEVVYVCPNAGLLACAYGVLSSIMILNRLIENKSAFELLLQKLEKNPLYLEQYGDLYFTQYHNVYLSADYSRMKSLYRLRLQESGILLK